MFAKKAMLDAFAAGELSISYEYNLLDAPTRLPEAASIDPNNLDAIGTKIFEKYFFGDRLALTLGPIVVSDKIHRLPGRVLFKGRKSHFDLTQTNGQIEIMPGEGFAVHSIENIRMGPKIGAYILPRLTLATVGLVVIPTYIDPYWEGILQLYIVNLSARPYNLKLGERIAICRFYGIQDAEENQEAKRLFTQKSHHYGLNWNRILDTDADVQPRRKHPVPTAIYRERLRTKVLQLLTNWHNFLGWTAGGILIAALYAFAKFDSKAGQIDSLTTEVQTLKSTVDRQSANQQMIERDFPQSGTLNFELQTGQQQLSQEVTLEKRLSRGAQVVVLPDAQTIVANGELFCGSGMSDCKLRISVQRTGNLSQQLNAQVKWLILSR